MINQDFAEVISFSALLQSSGVGRASLYIKTTTLFIVNHGMRFKLVLSSQSFFPAKSSNSNFPVVLFAK